MKRSNWKVATVAVASAILAAMTAGASVTSEATLLRCGPMGREPTVDGVISEDEMARASACYGLVSAETRIMAVRVNAMHFGWTEKGVYLAVRSSRPMSPLRISDKDAVELRLLSPSGVTRNFRVGLRSCVKSPAKGFVAATTERAGTQDYGALCNETELFVPFETLGVRTFADGEKWGLQVVLDYSSPAERASWHFAEDGSAYGTFIPDRTMPVTGLMDFDPMESWRHSGNCKLRYRYYNPTKDAVAVESKTRIFHGLGFSKLDANPEEQVEVRRRQLPELNARIEPGETVERIPIVYNLWAGTVNILETELVWDEKTVNRRTLRWDCGHGLNWKSEEPLPQLRFAFLPSAGNAIRYAFTSWGVPLSRATFTVRGPGGKTFYSKEFKGNPTLPGAVAGEDARLGDLPLGDYVATLESVSEKGRSYTDERTFSVRKFKWQGLNLGKERVIVPPFKPIKVEKRGGGGDRTDRISFTLTGYRCVGVLWDEVVAQGENILVAPVSLKLNGAEFKVKSSKFVEQSPDRVIRELTASTEQSNNPNNRTITLRVTQDYDYDGFCMVTFDFDVSSPVTVSSLEVVMPIKDSVVSLYEVPHRNDKRDLQAPDFKIPTGTGEIWDSSRDRHPSKGVGGMIQPYIWVGGPEKGFSWIVESRKDWSIREDRPAERMIRRDGALTVVCDLVNKETRWERGRKSYRMGFMPTPAKPMVRGHYREAEVMWDYPCPSNAVRFSRSNVAMCSPLTGRMHVYPGMDLSYPRWALKTKCRSREELKERIDAYVEKNREWFKTCKSTSLEDYRREMPSWIRWTDATHLFYLNPELNTCMWPEWEMYKAEWHCEAWPVENMIHEYLGRPVPSRIDKLLFDGYKALKLGYDGIYYDCFTPGGDWDYLVHSNGAFLVEGDVNSYFQPTPALTGLLQWRELLKRTAVMCYLHGTKMEDQPYVELHATEGNVAMCSSWCSNNLCTERGSNGGDFQDRFPEGYTLTEITGRQTGAVPKIIVSARTGDRARCEREVESLMGYMCAYGIFGLTDQGVIRGQKRFEKAWNTVFDFGWGQEGVEMRFYYDGKPQPVTHDGNDVRLTVAKKSGAALLMFGNLGDETEFSFDVSGLGFGKVALTDAETGEALGEPKLSIARHGFRLVRVEPVK